MNILGVNIADVWYDIFPVRNGKNRLYNELSVKLLDRVISFSSNKGDLILDPFWRKWYNIRSSGTIRPELGWHRIRGLRGNKK